MNGVTHVIVLNDATVGMTGVQKCSTIHKMEGVVIA